jgi:hypothetical protein
MCKSFDLHTPKHFQIAWRGRYSSVPMILLYRVLCCQQVLVLNIKKKRRFQIQAQDTFME